MGQRKKNSERLIKEIKKNMKSSKKDHEKDYENEYDNEYESDYENDYHHGHEHDHDHEGEENENNNGHVHEVLGSTMIAEREEDPHNHRFAAVSGEAMPFKRSHIHKICTNTDFYEDHHHEIDGKSGIAIEVGEGKHVHFASGETTFVDGHRHEFRVASLIEDPIGEGEDEEDHHKKGKKKEYEY
jgi:hypothetical protein